MAREELPLDTDGVREKGGAGLHLPQRSGLAWFWVLPLTGIVALVLFVLLPAIFPSPQHDAAAQEIDKTASATTAAADTSQQLIPLPPPVKHPAYDWKPEGAKQIIVLMYHNFLPGTGSRFEISPETFAAELELLDTEGYKVIPLSAAIEAMEKHDYSQLPAKPVVITVDDGYENFYSNAWPLLQEHKMPATLSIYTSFISSCKAALSWEQLQEMVDSGWIEIASHTQKHSNLAHKKKGETDAAFAARQQEEIAGSKKLLEEKLGKPVLALTYPGGNRSNETDALVQQAGYRACLTIYDGPNLVDGSPFKIRRYGIYRNTTLEMFNNYLTGARVSDEDFHIGKPVAKETKKKITEKAKAKKAVTTKPADSKTTGKKPDAVKKPETGKVIKRPGTYN